MVRVDLNKYRINKKDILELMKSSTGTREELISRIAVATHTPVLAVAHFVGEEHGFDDKLNSTIQNLIKFYDIEGIDNIEKKE